MDNALPEFINNKVVASGGDITGQPGQKKPTLGQLKIWIDRLEKVGIHIDVNEILNPKKEQETTKFPPGV